VISYIYTIMKLELEQNRSFIGEKEIIKYKEFALKQDMTSMSIAFILGASFNKVVNGISDFILMPVINFIISKTGDSWRQLYFEPLIGLKFEIGKFLGVLVDFFLASIILYIIYSKIISSIFNYKDKVLLKQCPLCKSDINQLAIKCPRCTGDLECQAQKKLKKK